MRMNWNAFTVCVTVGVAGIVALIVGQTDIATVCIGALVGLLAPSPFPPAN